MVNLMRPKTQLAFALPCVLFASLFTAAGGAVVKYTADLLSTEMVVFARMFVSLLFLAGWIEISRDRPWKEKLRTAEWKTHLIRGVFGLTTLFLYFYSLKFLYLADATLFYNTMPIFVPLVAFFWKKIPIPHRIFWGIGTAFLGILLVLGPGERVFQPASFYALFAGATGAVATVALRFAHYTEPMERTLFYYFLVGTCVAFLFSLADLEDNFFALDAKRLYFLAIIGIFGFAYQILFTLAIRHAPARMISPSFYISVLFGIFFDWWIWGKIPSWLALGGFILVIVGAFLTLYLYPKERK